MGTGARRILIADDEVVVRMVVERLFARRGEHAKVVASAADAVAALAQGVYDIVVTDIKMPGGGGAAVAAAAHARGIPLVFITGFADSGEVQEHLDRGAPVVRKPFSPDQLLAAIEEVLRPRAPHDPAPPPKEG